MNNSRLIPLILFACLLATFSCKSKKAVKQPVQQVTVKPMATEKLVKQVKAQENDFTYYSARAKFNYKDPSQEQDLDMSIVMEKDKYIWVNITAILGLPVARALITKDSVMLLDQIHRKCIMADYSYIKKLTNADLKLKQLQQLIIGNAPFENDEKMSVADSALSGIVLYTMIQSQKQTASYDNTFRLLKTLLEDRNTSRQFTAEYSNPYIHGNNAYPAQVNINIRAEKSVECKLSLSNFVFEKKKEALFSIPKSYEVVKP